MATAEYIIWHISASPYGTAGMIREWHQARGWRDIGYHGVILNGYLTSEDWQEKRRVDWLDGEFEMGRLWDGDGFLEKGEVGAQAYGFNGESMGLCIIALDRRGEAQVTPKQLETALKVTRRWMDQFGVRPAHVIGHREIGIFKPQFATDKTCPCIDMEFVRTALTGDRDLIRSMEANFQDYRETA